MKVARLNIAILIAAIFPFSAPGASIDYVIHISVDGLRPDAITTLGSGEVPNFYRLRTEGAFTDNARTDVDHTSTLPNHTSQLTGRGVGGGSGHSYTGNSTPSSATTLETNKGSYVSSVFDVAHDNGLATGLYASKEKFILFDQSYGASTGGLDMTGPDDNGRDKIDSYLYDSDTGSLVTSYLGAMTSAPFNYSLLHLRDPDSAGHSAHWDLTSGSTYLDSIVAIDGLLGGIFDTITTDTTLNGKTAIVLTADHGGRLGTGNHDPATDSENYTVPFYVWGPGVAAGADLYTLNLFGRTDPGTTQPAYTDPDQPIRNGDAGNLALDLLGLGPIPGSTINAMQDLSVAPIPLPAALPMMLGALFGLGFLRRVRLSVATIHKDTATTGAPS